MSLLSIQNEQLSMLKVRGLVLPEDQAEDSGGLSLSY